MPSAFTFQPLLEALCVILGIWANMLSTTSTPTSKPVLMAAASRAFVHMRRQAELRYFGLANFGITLVKVGLYDMNHVQYGYRILALLGLGLLLLATSVVYGKASQELHPRSGWPRPARAGPP